MLAASTVLLCAASQGNHEQRGLRYVDLTDEFDVIWQKTSALPDSQRAPTFRAEFAKVLPGFYDSKRTGAPEDKYDAKLLAALKLYPSQRAGIQHVSGRFAAMIRPAQRSFERVFGPMNGYPPVYLVHSLGEFDGGVRELPEGERLMFGADVIDKVHGGKPVQPFFHHELFHLLHFKSFSGCEEVWCTLWSEGLAVYVAARLNPTADDAALLLTLPRPLRSAVDAHREKAVCAVRSRFHSTKPGDLAWLFMLGGKEQDPELPSRFGYYMGYLAARDLGRTRSLSELASLHKAEVEPLLEKSLVRMSAC